MKQIKICFLLFCFCLLAAFCGNSAPLHPKNAEPGQIENKKKTPTLTIDDLKNSLYLNKKGQWAVWVSEDLKIKTEAYLKGRGSLLKNLAASSHSAGFDSCANNSDCTGTGNAQYPCIGELPLNKKDLPKHAALVSYAQSVLTRHGGWQAQQPSPQPHCINQPVFTCNANKCVLVKKGTAGKYQRPAEGDRQASIEQYKAGIAFYNQGEYDKAKQAWEEALRLSPDNSDAALGLKRIEAILNSR